MKLCGKDNKRLGKFIDNESRFHTAEEKVMEGTRYWKPTGDERFSAVRIRWDKIMGMLAEIEGISPQRIKEQGSLDSIL